MTRKPVKWRPVAAKTWVGWGDGYEARYMRKGKMWCSDGAADRRTIGDVMPLRSRKDAQATYGHYAKPQRIRVRLVLEVIDERGETE
jgi:hypothetical protein